LDPLKRRARGIVAAAHPGPDPFLAEEFDRRQEEIVEEPELADRGRSARRAAGVSYRQYPTSLRTWVQFFCSSARGIHLRRAGRLTRDAAEADSLLHPRGLASVALDYRWARGPRNSSTFSNCPLPLPLSVPFTADVVIANVRTACAVASAMRSSSARLTLAKVSQAWW
jgi:hypothetical protein